MTLNQLLANRITKSTTKSESTTKPVVLFAIGGIGLGVMAMILSVMIVTGFRNEISNKVVGFMSDFRVNQFDTNNSFEETPCNINQPFVKHIKDLSIVKNIQPYAYKAGILKAKEDIQGIVLKGVDKSFDWTFFKSKLIEGQLPIFSDSLSEEVLISKSVAKKLKLKTGDRFLVFFIQKDRKVRRLKVAGIYNTGLSEDFDNIYLLCDLHLIQKINSWSKTDVGGFEISLKENTDHEIATRQISEKIGFDFNLKSTKEIYPQIFNWLELQNLNVFVIITLITLVAGITMISTLLILVLENSKQIGLLKALGASDKLIGKTYQMVGSRLLLRGMLIGNIVAILFAFLQIKFGILSLDEESYYINQVPINFTWTGIIVINLSTYLICMLMLIIPSKVISNISPIKVLRFE